MAHSGSSTGSARRNSLASKLPGARAIRRALWEKSIKDSLVLSPDERFRHAYRVQIPVEESHDWVRVILAITSTRLVVLMAGHLQVEADVGAVAHRYFEQDTLYLTLRAEEQNWKISVRTPRAEDLRDQLVSAAEKRLGRGHSTPVPVFLAAIVQAAAEAQSQNQRSDRDPDQENPAAE